MELRDNIYNYSLKLFEICYNYLVIEFYFSYEMSIKVRKRKNIFNGV